MSVPGPGVSPVVPFNDGFATAKQDDCQQGFQSACQWLSHQPSHAAPFGLLALTIAGFLLLYLLVVLVASYDRI